MALPLYLAATGTEISSYAQFSFPCAYMACHFSPYSNGLTNLPEQLPVGSILILNDSMPCQGHCADVVAQQLLDTVIRLKCESVLLDFQRPSEPESEQMVKILTGALPCPVAVTQAYAQDLPCPVFLAPAPLHIPLAEYLQPWRSRQIWLEAALAQEEIVITEKGSSSSHIFPPDGLKDGFFDDTLCCRYRIKAEDGQITFTLFDTRSSLEQKLALAQSLGVSRAIGLWQELGNV